MLFGAGTLVTWANKAMLDVSQRDDFVLSPMYLNFQRMSSAAAMLFFAKAVFLPSAGFNDNSPRETRHGRPCGGAHLDARKYEHPEADSQNRHETRHSERFSERSTVLAIFRGHVFTGDEESLFRERQTVRSFWRVTAAAHARVP